MTDKSKRFLAAVALGVMVAGCGVFGNKPGDVPTKKYGTSVCASGVVIVPCKDLFDVNLPEGTEGLLGLATLIASPYLEKTTDLKNCKVATSTVLGEGFSVEAKIDCNLNGVPVQEVVTINLTPKE